MSKLPKLSISMSKSIFWKCIFQYQYQNQYFETTVFNIKININMTKILTFQKFSKFCPMSAPGWAFGTLASSPSYWPKFPSSLTRTPPPSQKSSPGLAPTSFLSVSFWNSREKRTPSGVPCYVWRSQNTFFTPILDYEKWCTECWSHSCASW